MPASQLKQLKASLREHGVLGPQQSKKQRKANAKDGQKRLARNAALEGIRERFNPFEVKAPARREKFEVVSNKSSKSATERPGVTRGLGEERRRETLLKEIQSRKKVGGVLDRRFGENDPTMTPEERAAERFARQNEKKIIKSSMFNLEDDGEEEMTLTHGGRSLNFADDYEENDSASINGGLDAEGFNELDDRPTKRLRLDGEELDENEIPLRKKTKNEVMQEIIAKSKLHKAERQAAKADDDDIRMELDKGMSEFYDAIRSHKPMAKPAPPTSESEPMMDPARAAMLAGKSREAAEKEYEQNIRQLKLDARSKPTLRTKTEDEKAAEEAARLEELERKRIRRMKGEAESSDEEEQLAELGADETSEPDDAELFGLTQPEAGLLRRELDVEDEDEFVLDDDLIASDSDAEIISEEESDDEGPDFDDDGDDDFINGLVLPPKTVTPPTTKLGSTLAFTYPCPRNHAEFLDILEDTEDADLPIIVQRIRALYHKGLAAGNQEKLDKFSAVLVEHVAYLADTDSRASFTVIESCLRHLHSMAKGQPEVVGSAFRTRLSEISETRPLQLTHGDLVILTGISTIFPTSDHFHNVGTPAMMTIARYLSQSSVQTLHDLVIGAYTCSLALQYQRIAKRYVPEVILYTVNALAVLSPSPFVEKSKDGKPLNVPLRMPEQSLRIKSGAASTVTKLSFGDLTNDGSRSISEIAVLHTFIQLSVSAAELWLDKSAMPEIVAPPIHALSHICNQQDLPNPTLKFAIAALSTLKSLQAGSIHNRKPLLLHRHRPLAIKSSIPAFIENYNPDRHYDPDRERAELAKLKAEHKKERKGVMRELRKDANFVAREQLKEKKQKDEAYEKKFKRLVAEIQGEEGREAKDYEREKKKRKGRM